MILITRADAQAKILGLWAGAIEACEKVGAPPPFYSIDRATNADIEADLAQIFGELHVIAEWCPFNGVFCRWCEECPAEQIRRHIEIGIIYAPIELRWVARELERRERVDSTHGSRSDRPDDVPDPSAADGDPR